MARALLALLAAIWLPMAAFAQDQPLALKIEERRARAEARDAARSAQPGMVIDVAPRDKVQGEAFCVPITSIRVEGVTLLPDAVINDVISEYSQGCMGQAAIDTLLQVLSDLYLERGYITSRAYIPAQDLSTGALQLVVVEGMVEDIAFARTLNGVLDMTPNPRRVRLALPLQPGDPLELRALEQGIEQMNSVGSANVAVDIQPGSQLGGSILVIKADDTDIFRGQVSYQTGRGRGVSDQTLGLSMTADNLLQANESWSLSLNGGVNSNALTFGVTLPVRNWTASASLSYSEQLSQLTATTELFEQTVTKRLSLRRLMSRNATQKTHLTLAFNDSDVSRSVNGTALTDQGNRSLALSLSRDITGNGYFTSLSGGITAGQRKRGGEGYGFVTLSAQHNRSFGQRWSLYSTIDGQISGRALPSNEQFFIGGSGVVRGFQGGSVSGDSGFATSHELSVSLADFTPKGMDPAGPQNWATTIIRNSQPYLFVDGGIVRPKAQPRSAMLSAGLGLRTRIKGFGLDVGLAIPLSAEGVARKNGPAFRLSINRLVF